MPHCRGRAGARSCRRYNFSMSSRVVTPGGTQSGAAHPAEPRVGTCSFTAAGWAGTFYPEGLPAAEQLSFYATQFDALEVDSTFYATPAARTVRQWYDRTPANFLFCLKLPQAITHERCLVECDEPLEAFLKSATELREKLGAILIQFPYFNRATFPRPQEFFARLERFLADFPVEIPRVVEIRNKSWIGPPLLDVLKARRTPLALIDHPWMMRPSELLARGAAQCGDLAYIRLLGDRYAIEKKTKVWNRVIEDRGKELREWVEICSRLSALTGGAFVFVNNHYSGYAPETAMAFRQAWAAGLPRKASAEVAAGLRP
jgi:uncharacterized protein YecE (DUF72 family)